MNISVCCVTDFFDQNLPRHLSGDWFLLKGYTVDIIAHCWLD